jgi:glycosyltransferase involved in cell wall biosynthesis
MTLLTREMLRGLQAAGPVRSYNWSPPMTRRGFLFRVRRNFRILKSLARLVARGRVDGRILYLVSNMYSGLYLTALAVLVSRALGYVVYLHHHVYSYIDRHDWRMAWIDRRMGPGCVHVVHGDKMADDFRKQYQSQCDFAIVHPSILPVAMDRPRTSTHRPFCLGLLSYLSRAKGLDVALATFEALREAGRDVTLTLAGPVQSAKDMRLVEEAVARHPQFVRHLGPVYGADKTRFFAEIDAFVFPTMTESWGLVLNESLGAGVPVVTFNRGCTAVVVGEEAGLLIDPNSSFVEPAVRQLERWMDHPDEYCRASEAAVAQAEHLHREGQRTLAEFTKRIFAAARHAPSPRPSAKAPQPS